MRVLRNVFGELCIVEDTITKIAFVCWAGTSAFNSQQLVWFQGVFHCLDYHVMQSLAWSAESGTKLVTKN